MRGKQNKHQRNYSQFRTSQRLANVYGLNNAVTERLAGNTYNSGLFDANTTIDYILLPNIESSVVSSR